MITKAGAQLVNETVPVEAGDPSGLEEMLLARRKAQGLGLRNQARRVPGQGLGLGRRTFAVNDPETCGNLSQRLEELQQRI